MQFITNIPLFVYPLFIFLCALSYYLSKPRDIPKNRALIVTTVLIAFSSISAFMFYKANLNGFIAWLFGAVFLVALGFKLNFSKDIIQHPRHFQMRGGYFIPTIIMLIFMVKFFAGILTGIMPEFAKTTAYIVIFSAIYGSFSGIFISRFLEMLNPQNHLAKQ